MTLLVLFVTMFSDCPVLLWLVAIACDTLLLSVAMLTGVIHA